MSETLFHSRDPDGLFAIRGCSAIRLVEADADLLQGLLEKCDVFNILLTGLPAGETDAIDLFKDLPPGKELRDKTVIGFIHGSQLIGVLDSIIGYPENGTWFIGLFLLDPVARGKTLGQKLVKAYETWAGRQGACSVRLGVVEENTRGLNFWQKCGYEVIERKPPRVFGLKEHKVLLMQKEIGRRNC
jgi:GNAT superfamily N-acetyltransferase